MKSKVMDRPMFRKGQGKEMDPENVGIMQGFADMMDEEMPEDENEDEGEEREDEDEGEEGGKMEERSPKSPEILMNNLRGDMRSIDARVEELADLVGYNAAVNTPTEVLALLQPVLAAEAQQGIGALPQGMPPGMPPAAPPGMPPGAPVGIEALMAGAGAPPGMPPGMPPAPGPVNMAAGGYVRGYKSGGYVQHFQEGSDEEGVTPVEELPSGPGAYSPEMIARARTEVANFLSRQPLTVPDLATVTAQRVPMYEKLLGVDKNLSQGQMLFDIAQAAFNFAGNVDEQGRPLTGSLMSRLGRAAAPLPAKVGARVAEQAKADQMIKLTALQAAEKDVSDIRAQNAKLIETQRKAWSDMLKAGGMDKGFGTGKEGQILNYFVKYAPEYAAGTLSDELSRRFETAVRDYTQRKEIETIDPVTGNKSIRTVQNQLPTFVTEALKGRNKLETLTGVGTGGTAGKTTAPKPEAKPAWMNEPPAGGATTQPVPAPTAPAAPSAAAPAQGQPAQGGTQPAENRLAIPNYSPVDPLQVNPRTQSYFTQANPTMFGASFRGTGIPSAVGSFAYRIPFVGPALGSKEMAEARAYLESATNRINRAIATSPRFAETERQQIQKQLDLMPAIFDNPTAYRSRLFVLDDFLTQLQEEALRNTFNDQLTVEQRQQAREKATDVHGMREIIGSPLRIYSATDPRLQTLPNGTPFLWNGEEWGFIKRKQGAR